MTKYFGAITKRLIRLESATLWFRHGDVIPARFLGHKTRLGFDLLTFFLFLSISCKGKVYAIYLEIGVFEKAINAVDAWSFKNNCNRFVSSEEKVIYESIIDGNKPAVAPTDRRHTQQKYIIKKYLIFIAILIRTFLHIFLLRKNIFLSYGESRASPSSSLLFFLLHFTFDLRVFTFYNTRSVGSWSCVRENGNRGDCWMLCKWRHSGFRFNLIAQRLFLSNFIALFTQATSLLCCPWTWRNLSTSPTIAFLLLCARDDERLAHIERATATNTHVTLRVIFKRKIMNFKLFFPFFHEARLFFLAFCSAWIKQKNLVHGTVFSFSFSI